MAKGLTSTETCEERIEESTSLLRVKWMRYPCKMFTTEVLRLNKTLGAPALAPTHLKIYPIVELSSSFLSPAFFKVTDIGPGFALRSSPLP